MKKKLGLLLLLLIMAISIFTLSACGVSNDGDDGTSECRHRDKDNDGVCDKCDLKIIYSEGLAYELVNNEYYKVVGIGTCQDTELYIPKTYNNLPVKEIDNSAFNFCYSLTSVTIPDSITSIGESAFYNCASLTSITVDKNNAYYKDIDGNLYSKNGKTLIRYAIGKNDTSFNIPQGVTSIGDYAFLCSTSLTSVEMPNSVTSIGDWAFLSCKSLTSITIPDSVTRIGDYAFSSCTNLTSIEIPNSVTSIGSSAFEVCHRLTNVTIPNSVTSIGKSAFNYCINLVSVEIPNSVTSIGDEAFNCCVKLVEVINKSSLNITTTSYGLSALTVHSGDTETANKDGYLFYTFEGVNYLLGYLGEDKDLTLPENYNGENYEIYNYAFARDDITSVAISNGVTSIGNYAFYDCDSLASITISNSVTSIGNYAFYDCDNLTSITFADTSTWYRTIGESDWNNKTNGTQTDVSAPTNNDDYFISAYHDYYWYKK